MSVAEYLGLIATRFDIDREIMSYYIYIMTKSRLSQHELSAEEYRDAMKCVVLIVKRYIHN